MNEDKIYIDEKLGNEPFRFDDSVVQVFPDMLRRSIPGYAASLEAIGSLAARYVTAGTNCYDLGCSLGAATLAMRQGIQVPSCKIIAVDNAPAMIGRCEEVISHNLTPLQRRIFHLKHLRQQPIRAIASALGKSVDAVKANLYRMRRAISAGTPGLEGILRS